MKFKWLPAAVLVLFLGGCTNKGTPQPEKTLEQTAVEIQQADTVKIGISMPDTHLDRWAKDGEFLSSNFEERGCGVILSYADSSVSKQILDLDMMIASDVDILIITPIEMDALTDVLGKASKKKIPVVCYDRIITGCDAVKYYVSFDNYKVGQLQGEYIKTALDLGNTDKVYTLEITGGDIGDNNAAKFYDGAMDVLNPYIDSGKLDVRSGQTALEDVNTPEWSTGDAQRRMRKIISEFYTDKAPDALLCSNDSTAKGVINALDENFKKYDCVVTGQDGDDDNLAMIKDGRQSMTVFKDNSQEAQVTFTLCVSLINGQRPDDRMINIAGWDFECVFNDKDYNNGTANVSAFLLTPEVITKDNLDNIKN